MHFSGFELPQVSTDALRWTHVADVFVSASQRPYEVFVAAARAFHTMGRSITPIPLDLITTHVSG